MLKKCGGLVLGLLLVLTICVPAFGEDVNEQPVSLDNAFTESSLLPFDFKGYAFVNGELFAYNDAASYKNYNKNGRVLVPIRLMTSALEDLENAVYWNVGWDAAQPELVTLTTSFEPKYKVVITVGSKTMQVNGQEIPLDVPAQLIDNRIVLPLRAIGEAVNREVSWLNDMIIISKVPLDLTSDKTKDVAAKAKNQLSACSQDIYDKLDPIAVYHDGYYALKTCYDAEGGYVTELYFYKEGKAEKINLAGEPQVGVSYSSDGSSNSDPKSVVGDSLYYPTKIGSETKLYRLDFATNSSVEVCSLSADHIGWSLDHEGWFGGVIRLGQDTFVVLHSGDWTMGGDTIYRLVNNSLVHVGDPKVLSSIAQVGTRLYYTSLDSMGMTENNLFYFDLAKDEPEAGIALEGYTYDIVRKATENFTSLGVSTYMDGLAVKDNDIYSMLYEERGGKDNRNVVKINTTDNTQTILPLEVSKFWLVTDGIVYQEYTSGKLMKSDFDGNNARVLADKNLDMIKAYGSEVYYTVTGEAGLYHLNAVTETGEKLSDMVADDILINKSGSYFINKSYEAGIFKISGGQTAKIADGFVQGYINTDGGILYNKRSSAEVHLAK
ncbi:MAG: copper amine oxidase N-terminal domain-containing protein [Dehalobacterium sp.]